MNTQESATKRDLTGGYGVIVTAPGEFYPRDTNGPNDSRQRYEEFLTLVEEELKTEGWKFGNRERYQPGPPNTGNAFEYLYDLITIADFALTAAQTLYPDEMKEFGGRIKSAVAARIFKKSVRTAARRVGVSSEVTDKVAVLEGTLRDLCFIDACSDRTANESMPILDSTVHFIGGSSSGARQWGPETYVFAFSTNRRALTYRVNGYGRGTVRIYSRVDGTANECEVSLLDGIRESMDC
ncbi:MAG: hypothetical protein WBA63_00685 [Thermomicrobiales bacterium]